MLILAVDPGNEETAWLVYNSEFQHIVACRKERNERLVKRFGAFLPDGKRPFCLPGHGGLVIPEMMAIEMVQHFGMGVGQDIFETCVWIGRFMEQWGPWMTHWVYRMQVKMHVCHHSRATDAAVRAALIDRFGKPGTKKNPGKTYGITADMWSALAIAVTYAEGGSP
jgi:hypothetical protein